MKAKVRIVTGLLSLAGLLSYTWTHTGGLLAGYVRPELVGYLCAGGIELSIVGLSLRIGELRQSNVKPKFLVSTLIAVVVVSALANISEGFAVKFGEPLTLTNIGQLDIVQAVVSIAATGLISLVTRALSEIVGADVNAATQASRLSSQPSTLAVSTSPTGVSSPVQLDIQLDRLEHPQTVKGEQDVHTKVKAMDTLLDYLKLHPDAGVSELAKALGRSRTTVYCYLNELNTAGKMHRNGRIAVLDSK